MRGPRQRGVDIVKAEQQELTEHDALAKRTGCAILLIHHTSKGSAGLDWSEKAAGTFAMSAATESQINISRFAEMDIAARKGWFGSVGVIPRTWRWCYGSGKRLWILSS